MGVAECAGCQMSDKSKCEEGRTATNLKQIVVSYSHHFLAAGHSVEREAWGDEREMDWTDRLTMMAPSSTMHPEPMTMGPAMANMVAFG